MAKRRNKPLRIFVPLVLSVVGIVAAFSFLRPANPSEDADPAPSAQQDSQQSPDPASQQDTSPDADDSENGAAQPSADEPATSGANRGGQPERADPDAQDSGEPDAGETRPRGRTAESPESPESPESSESPETTDANLQGLRSRPWPDPGGDRQRRFEHTDTPLGSLDPDGPHRMLVEFSRYGAGIDRLTLARYFDSTAERNHIQLQQQYEYEPEADGVTPLAADAVTVGDQTVRLQAVPDERGIETRIWKPVEADADPANTRAFRALIENESGEPILEITRTYRLRPDSYELTIDQRVRNLTDAALEVRLRTYGPVELPRIAKYPGDRRRVRHGYLLSPERDAEQRWVQPSGLPSRRSELGNAKEEGSGSPPRYNRLTEYWPTDQARENNWTLVWLAQTNRYFSVAVHDAGLDTPDAPRALDAAASVDRFVLNRDNTEARPPVLAYRLTSEPMEVAPADAADLGVALYAGPKAKETIARHDAARFAGLGELVVYNIGGACSFCTFSWLSGFLIEVLRGLHDYVVFDWALAIIGLVLIVRTILHPVTRWSQIRVQRFGKQMQEIAPKQKKIQERFKDDRKRQQEEMAKLWREEGISPAGLLGCLPMFLQMPVWIALYATLYYAFELRHAGAFFGLFQEVFNNWAFLADLSEPDRFYKFAEEGFVIPLIGAIQGPINSLNILPLLMAAVLFLHQKYLTPPTSPNMTPEQKQQQQIVKVMTVVMLPVFMYNAPSGLALYFVANSTLGILENRWIRSHIDKHDLLNIEKMKAERKHKPGLMQRLQQIAEQKQRARQQQQQAAQRAQPASKGSTRDSRQSQQRYKKRR